jgi:hypothetical protein
MKYLLVSAVLFLSPRALADNPYEIRRNLPTVETTMIEGVPHKCFNTVQWQSVLLLGSDYQGLYDWRLKILGILDAHQAVIEGYELRIKGYENELKNKDRYIVFQRDHINDLTKKHRNEALEERIEKYVMWAVIIAETVVIGVIGAKSL